jgi:hypothetical protein
MKHFRAPVEGGSTNIYKVFMEAKQRKYVVGLSGKSPVQRLVGSF